MLNVVSDTGRCKSPPVSDTTFKMPDRVPFA